MQSKPRTMSAEREAAIERIGNGQFTGIADGQTLAAIRDALKEVRAERAISKSLAEALEHAAQQEFGWLEDCYNALAQYAASQPLQEKESNA